MAQSESSRSVAGVPPEEPFGHLLESGRVERLSAVENVSVNGILRDDAGLGSNLDDSLMFRKQFCEATPALLEPTLESPDRFSEVSPIRTEQDNDPQSVSNGLLLDSSF